jgi:uncharacterized protein YkwD
VVATLAATLGIVGTGMAAVSPATAVTDDWPSRMLAKVNAIRAEVGVPPVRECAVLDRSAARYARSMASTGVVTHAPADGTDPRARMQRAGYSADLAGENLAGGQETVVRVMRAWRASPRHYALLTDPRLKHVGFGYARNPDSRYEDYWVQHFGAGGTCT